MCVSFSRSRSLSLTCLATLSVNDNIYLYVYMRKLNMSNNGFIWCNSLPVEPHMMYSHQAKPVDDCYWHQFLMVVQFFFVCCCCCCYFLFVFLPGNKLIMSSKNYASVVLRDVKVTYFEDREDTVFPLFLYCASSIDSVA